jgi:L-ribulose-5-phosphate 4-epimerase
MNSAELCAKLNKDLSLNKITMHTWGNVSIYDPKENLIYIKPSGVEFLDLVSNQISVLDLSGKQIKGLKPSVDCPTHIEIYKAFPNIRCILHTHSKYTTSWCQARKSIPILGTTHADYFEEDIPLLDLTEDFNFDNYETNIGNLIVQYFISNHKDPLRIGAILLANHGIFLFSNNPNKIIEYAITLEYIAEIAFYSCLLGINQKDNSKLFAKHFTRKHGENKYYGQS